MTQGIYTITNLFSKRVYVGLSVSIEARWYVHRNTLNRNIHITRDLQQDWNRLGSGAFSFQIIEVIADSQNLRARETYWIQRLRGSVSVYNQVRVTRVGGVRPSRSRVHQILLNRGMRVNTRLLELMGQKRVRDGKRISLRSIARDTGISRETLNRMANNTILDFPGDAVVKLCAFFGCQLSDLLVIENDAPKEPIVEPEPPHATDMHGNNER